MASNMRGLTQFIADIRAARVRELEEKRINKEMANIRKKFKDASLTSTQRKKYVAKIIFTYILGYKVDIGHMEAVNLISSSKYSEKQIVRQTTFFLSFRPLMSSSWPLQGYLAVTLLMHENSDFLRLVVNSIGKDLESHSEINNCLALHAIANVGGDEIAEALAPDVHRLLISPTSQSFVKKKAALTLLRLYRKQPQVIPAEEWALRIVSIMEDPDLGVAVCVTSLVLALAQDHLDAYAICYQKAVGRLHKLIIDHEYPPEYIYYKVPTPWLQVKLLRLLQYYPPSDDPMVREALDRILQAILNASSEPIKNVQHNNAQNAILFEAIGLAIHLDPKSALVTSATTLLAHFILSKETNVRYLGLDTLAHLAARADSLEQIKKQQTTILLSLRDKDISVRRRALDLLYSMCDVDNAELIVGELLRYLKVADYGLREEMVLKIAISTEKFATSYKWYVDTILQLISTAGDHVGDEVWYRVVQIVTNTEDLQEYAAKVTFEHLKNPTCHESLIKIGGYILGEYGHVIADAPGYSPTEQLQLLQSKASYCSAPTRALLLSTYLKWVNVFPEIKQSLLLIFDRYSHVLDSELQQRACEYLAIASRPEEDELLQNICEEMPPFPARESSLLARLNKKQGDTEDKRTWVIGGKEANDERELKRSGTVRKGGLLDGNADGKPQQSNGADSILGDLQGLDLSASPPAQDSTISNGLPNAKSVMPPTTSSPSTTSAAAVAQPLIPTSKPAVQLTVTPNTERWYERLTYMSESLLYEDLQLQIGYKSEFHGHLGRLALYFGNKLSTPLTSFSASIEVADPEALSISFAKMPPSTVTPRLQTQQIINVECKNIFTTPPILKISYLAGSLQTINLRLPVVLTKFFEPVKLAAPEFFERWKLIGGPPREAQQVFPIGLVGGAMDVERQRKIVEGNKLYLLTNVDPNQTNSVGAGVLHMSAAGKVGCLVRVEPSTTAKLCRVTVRSTSEVVAAEILQLLRKPLSLDAVSAAK
ncbi:hypothetical protein FRB95_014476 [Tulasnella sp. JGI-2019a]|nr:hypothetical protein FRB95_014476 [Tulasnella sp. JGI-2019a]